MGEHTDSKGISIGRKDFLDGDVTDDDVLLILDEPIVWLVDGKS